MSITSDDSLFACRKYQTIQYTCSGSKLVVVGLPKIVGYCESDPKMHYEWIVQSNYYMTEIDYLAPSWSKNMSVGYML